MQAMLDLEQLLAVTTAPQSQEAARLRAKLELQLIEYKAERALRSTLEEGRQEMTIRLHDKLRRLRATSRRLKTVLLQEPHGRNPELILYEAAPVVAKKPAETRAKKAAKKSTIRRAEKSKRPARSGERCRRCQSKK
jgi:hypothetical protein